MYGLCIEIECCRLHFWPLLAPQIAHLYVQARIQVCDRSLCV